MWIKDFSIFVGSMAVLSTTPASAAVVPTAPASIPLMSLLGGENTVVAGPFTFEDFALLVQTGNAWQSGPSSLAATLQVRPIMGHHFGIELSGSPAAAGLMATYAAVAIEYQLSGTNDLGNATSTLYATATDPTATMANQFVVSSPASSDTPVEADTSWSSASAAASVSSPVAIDFYSSSALSVSDVSVISPSGASTLSFAIDAVFVPEPGASALVVVGLLLARRRGVAL